MKNLSEQISRQVRHGLRSLFWNKLVTQSREQVQVQVRDRVAANARGVVYRQIMSQTRSQVGQR